MERNAESMAKAVRKSEVTQARSQGSRFMIDHKIITGLTGITVELRRRPSLRIPR
jgi:hypothetical protein